MTVPWGKTSSILVGLILLSLIPVIQTWQETGDFPTNQAWITAGLTAVLGFGRYIQTFFPAPGVADEGDADSAPVG